MEAVIPRSSFTGAGAIGFLGALADGPATTGVAASAKNPRVFRSAFNFIFFLVGLVWFEDELLRPWRANLMIL
jgi:hypothetical protein